MIPMNQQVRRDKTKHNRGVKHRREEARDIQDEWSEPCKVVVDIHMVIHDMGSFESLDTEEQSSIR